MTKQKMVILAAVDSDGDDAGYAVLREDAWQGWCDGMLYTNIPDAFGLFYGDGTPADVFDNWAAAMQHVVECEGELVDVHAAIAY